MTATAMISLDERSRRQDEASAFIGDRFISNRYVAAARRIYLEAPRATLAGNWVVSDVDGHYGEGPISEYASEGCALRVLRAEGGWVLCTDRGMFLRHPRRADGRKSRVRVFKTPLSAAVAAEDEDGSGR
jgi:hypothetical protein